MATLVANSIYLMLGGVNISAFFTDVQVKAKNNTKDSTAGSGATHVQRQPGLDDYDYTVTIVHDPASVASYIQQLKPGTVETLDYGPNNNIAGQPRMTQSVIIADVSHAVKVAKDLVAFTFSASGASAPTNNMYSGATF